ncbi:MAG: hypothetical protein ACREPT_02880 [Rudaea sp.]
MKLLSIWVVCAALSFLSGCTYTTFTKNSAIRRAEQDAHKRGITFGGASGIHIGKYGALTVSTSANYLRGRKKGTNFRFVDLTSFAIGADQGLKISFRTAVGNCEAVSSQVLQAARQSIDGITAPIVGQIPAGAIDVYFIPNKVEYTINKTSVDIGRRVHLFLYYPCIAEDAEKSFFFAYLDIVHELTHALTALDGVSMTPTQTERVAIGSAGCVYEALSSSHERFPFLNRLTLEKYLNSSPYMGSVITKNDVDPEKLCALWKSAMRLGR